MSPSLGVKRKYMSWDDTNLMRLELHTMSALKYTDGIMRFGPQFNRLTATKVELFVVSAALQERCSPVHTRVYRLCLNRAVV